MLLINMEVYAISPSQGIEGSQKDILSEVHTYAGSGLFNYEDGEVSNAAFRNPAGIVTLADGSILVSDSHNQRIRMISKGEVTTYAGITFDNDELGLPRGNWYDAERKTAMFNHPTGMAADEQGNLYIADAGNHLIRKISVAGDVTTVAGDGIIGDIDGQGEKARFHFPQDVAIAPDGTLFVADTLNHLIRKVSVNGEVSTLNAHSNRVVEVVGGYVEPAGDYLDGNLQEAKFNEPSGLAIDNKGNLFISDTGNQLIRYIDFETNTVTTVAGNMKKSNSSTLTNKLYAEGGYTDGPALEAVFDFPMGIAVTEENGLLIADSLNHAIRYLINGQVITLAGNPKVGFGNSDGINGHNLLHHPTDVAIMQDGSIVIVDSYNNRIRQYIIYQLPDNLPQNNRVNVVLNDQIIQFESEPVIVKGRTMVPIQYLSEIMGYSVETEENEQVIVITKDDRIMKFKMNETTLSVTKDDGHIETSTMEIAPFMKDSRIFIPLRSFSEQIGLDVEWDQLSSTVILRTKEWGN